MKARAAAKGRSIQREMQSHGILVRAASLRTQQEEIADAQADGDVELQIHSPGGSVFDGVAIANLIRDHYRRSKYPDVIPPFTVLRRIDGVRVTTEDNGRQLFRVLHADHGHAAGQAAIF